MNNKFNVIDSDILLQLLMQFATKNEVATYFMCSEKELDKYVKNKFNVSYSELETTMNTRGKFAIKQKQMNLASTRPDMAKWLGMQYCGQKENDMSSERVILVANGYDLNEDEKKILNDIKNDNENK